MSPPPRTTAEIIVALSSVALTAHGRGPAPGGSGRRLLRRGRRVRGRRLIANAVVAIKFLSRTNGHDGGPSNGAVPDTPTAAAGEALPAPPPTGGDPGDVHIHFPGRRDLA